MDEDEEEKPLREVEPLESWPKPGMFIAAVETSPFLDLDWLFNEEGWRWLILEDDEDERDWDDEVVGEGIGDHDVNIDDDKVGLTL